MAGFSSPAAVSTGKDDRERRLTDHGGSDREVGVARRENQDDTFDRSSPLPRGHDPSHRQPEIRSRIEQQVETRLTVARRKRICIGARLWSSSVACEKRVLRNLDGTM